MSIRQPRVSGSFYPSSAQKCEAMIKECLKEKPKIRELPSNIVAGVVPHAGWFYSGGVAGNVWRVIKERGGADTFILFGSVHVWGVRSPSIFPSGKWATPISDVAVDEEISALILKGAGDLIQDDPSAHTDEHSLEVQIPFIKFLFPEAKIVPIMVPPSEGAEEVGRVCFELAGRSDRKVVAVGSSDLTHYGMSFGFSPKGYGKDAYEWVKNVNDRRLIDLALSMDGRGVVEEARRSHSACGAGAIAAAASFAREGGSSGGVLLQYRTSSDIVHDYSSFVGYAGLVF